MFEEGFLSRTSDLERPCGSSGDFDEVVKNDFFLANDGETFGKSHGAREGLIKL